MSKNQAEKAAKFRELHTRSGGFIIPNPWDVASARILEGLGFEALATTSLGFAYTLGRTDGGVTIDEVVEHCRALCAATDLPVSVDAENCYADAPEAAAANLRRIAAAGAVGCSIEDYSGAYGRPIYDFDFAVERVRAAVEAAHSLDFPFTLTARAENLLHGIDDLDDTIRRLKAYADAGADVLYAPGLKSLDTIRAVAAEIDKPLNVLAPLVKGATAAEMIAAGAQRLSVGGALARAAYGALIDAGTEMHATGTFDWTTGVPPGARIDRFFLSDIADT